jgi:predicted DNA-binding transcriptional regulator AlpA
VPTKLKRRTAAAPKTHHLDRRVDQLLRLAGSADLPDDGSDALLTTKQVAAWLGVSDQWLEVGRCKGYGPPYIRLSQRNVRYPRAALLKWLKQRRMVAPG